MRGVIISTGQWPRSGWRRTAGKPFAGTPQGGRAWAGVPGVQYPDTPDTPDTPAPQAAAGAPRYITTAGAAKLLGITGGAARAALLKAKAGYVLSGRRYLWVRADVEKTAKAHRRGKAAAAPPPGWLTIAEACRRAGVARSTLQRYMDRGFVRVRKMLLGTRRRRRIACITPEADIDKLCEAREFCLLAEEYRRKYAAAMAALQASNRSKTR